MRNNSVFVLVVFFFFLLVPLNSALAFNICVYEASDPDGDGWGWENNDSCMVDSTSIPNGSDSSPDNQCIDDDGDGWGWIQATQSSCQVDDSDIDPDPEPDPDSEPDPDPNIDQYDCVDSDGDGWGWIQELSMSCEVVNGKVDTDPDPDPVPDPADCVDSDGDGWGWNQALGISCQIEAPDVYSPFGVADITDVILTAGQSNSLGQDTVSDDVLDAPHERVFVWTLENGWKVANLKTQAWFSNGSPASGGIGHLVPGFRIAKSIVENDPNRIVGLIPTGVAGMPISFWDDSGTEFPHVINKVSDALAALPTKDEVDLIWWMQGEADDPNAIDYRAELDSLIARFRLQSWYNTGYFVANETVASDVNPLIRSLNNDGDPFTCYSEGEGFLASDTVHFDEPAIRDIGYLVSDKYLNGCYDFD